MASVWDDLEEVQPTNDIWADVEEVKTQPINKQENVFINFLNKMEEKNQKANEEFKNRAKENLRKRAEWEEKHPIISGIQKDYQPATIFTGGQSYRSQVPIWEQQAKYGFYPAPIKEQLKTDAKTMGLNMVAPINIGIDMATGGEGFLVKQGLKQVIKQGAKQGAKTGVIGGFTQGITSSLADNGISADLLTRPLSYATGGLLGGALLGSVAPVAVKGVEKVAGKIAKPKVKAQAVEQPQVTKEVKAEVVEQPIKQVEEVVENVPQEFDINAYTEKQPFIIKSSKGNLLSAVKKEDGWYVQGNKVTRKKDIDYLNSQLELNKKDNLKTYNRMLENLEDEFGIWDSGNLTTTELEILDDLYKKGIVTREPGQAGIHDTYNGVAKWIYRKNPTSQQLDEVIPEQVVEATGKTKERGFVDTVRQNYGDDVAKQITDKEYDVYSHEMQKANWENRTPEQKIQALNEADNINPDVLYGKAQALNQAIQNGEPLNVAMLDGIAKNLTKAGQEIEAAKHFIPTSPEGIVLETIKQTRKNTPKQVLKLKDETSQIVDEVAKTNAEIEKEFNTWLQKQNLPKQVKQYSEKGDRLALMKAMEKYRQGKIKGEFAKLEEKRLKAIDNILAKRVVKPAERKSLATQLLALNDNNGLTPENFARLVDKHYGIQTIDVSDYAKIQELSNRFINATTDRERDVANGLIKKFIWNKQPKKWADKDRTFRTMNMLLSLPSRLLDVTSTAAFQGIRATDKLVAKGIDKAMGTGLRGKMITPAEWWKSVSRGAKEEFENVGLGINTARSGEVDRYELGLHPQFEGVPILGKAEKGLNYSIRVPDRAFYEGDYDSAVADLLSTGKFTPEEVTEIANNEALQSVFQGRGILSESSKFIRDLLNARIGNKPMFKNDTAQNIADNIQLGNRIAPFALTPANLLAEGLERTPLGLAKGGFEMATATTPQQLRQAQMTLSKGLTGTGGLTLGGGYLLNKIPNSIGGFTNEDKFGDEVTGLPPQSVVIGDKAISLASMPFITIPMGWGKALLEPNKTMPERLLNTAIYTGNILSDIPMLKGLGDLYKGIADVGSTAGKLATKQADTQDVLQSIGRTAGQQGANILSQYIPFSGTLGTIRNAVDPYNREMMTYNENPLLGTAEYIGNRLQNRIPFASSLLPMKYNVLGEPSMRTNIENPVARIAEATLSPVRIRNYTERPAEMEEMQRIQDYAMENDITGKTTLKFAKPKRYIGRGKDKTRLTNEQYSELTRLYNGKVYDELQFLMNTPEYQSADEKTQIKWVREVMKEKKQEAEQEISDIIK